MSYKNKFELWDLSYELWVMDDAQFKQDLSVSS